jgi:4-amino-4-deoxy-L-arabinose transferase-like glycosyltransferase
MFRRIRLASLGGLFYGLLSGINVFLLTKGGINLSADSVGYLSIVQIFRTGHWAKLFVLTWPPLYPIAIASITSFGFEGAESARIISVISYFVLVVAIFALSRATAGSRVAHLTSVSMVFFAPLLVVYGFCWSETLFITLSALSLLALYRFFRSTEGTGNGHLIFCALLVGLTFLTRWAGVALFLACVLVVGFKGGTKLSSDKIKNLALFTLIACTPIALYMIGCSHYKGHPIPSANVVVTSLWQNFNLYFGTIYNDFLTFELGFADYVTRWQPGVPILALDRVVGLIIFVLCVLYFALRLFKNTIKDQIVPIAYVTCYSVFIIIISTVRYRTLIESRLLSSLYPFILLLAFIVIIAVGKAVAQRRSKVLLWGLSIFAVFFFWSVQIVSTVNLYRQASPDEESEVEYRDITGDGITDLADLIYLINYLYRAGPRPRPLENANVNCDETLNAGDVVYLIRYIYRAGPSPCNLEDR